MRTPYFPFYPGDYLADTLGLSCCQHGVYLLLLAISWQRGPLPDDMDHLSRLAANPPIEALRFILSEYWTLTERGWINARLERERAEVELKFQRRSDAGKKAISARWGKSYPQNDTKRIPIVEQSNTNQNQNQNHIPEPEKKTPRTKKPTFPPPTDVDPDLWSDFLDQRTKLRAQNTDRSIVLLTNKLAKIHADTGESFTSQIERSIEHGWKTVYPEKKFGNQPQRPQRQEL